MERTLLKDKVTDMPEVRQSNGKRIRCIEGDASALGRERHYENDLRRRATQDPHLMVERSKLRGFTMRRLRVGVDELRH